MSTTTITDTNIWSGTKTAGYITIISGLPRSGTSLMMNMLEASDFDLLTDGVRKADDNNPKGYFEFERVKKLKQNDISWLKHARGKAVKIISALLKNLPPSYDYKVIFMQRRMEEILASQKKMLSSRSNTTANISEEKMAELFHSHLADIKSWMVKQPNFEAIYINYNDVMTSPREYLTRVNHFLDDRLDIERMIGRIDQNLYRQRR